MSEDYISRKDLIEFLEKVTVTDGITFETGFKQILTDIRNMPSIQPMRPKGEWIPLGYPSEQYGEIFKCPFCDKETFNFDFCPNCGADMREMDEKL